MITENGPIKDVGSIDGATLQGLKDVDGFGPIKAAYKL
jgi:hypothetical protein